MEAVGDPVLHFLQQNLLLAQQLFSLFEEVCLLALDDPALGDVEEREEDRMRVPVVVDDLTRVEQHGAGAQSRKVVVDLKAVHGSVFRNDGLEKQSEGCNVPLAIAQVVQKLSLRLGGRHLEGVIEGPAGGQNAKSVIQHNEWLDERVYDGLCKRLSIGGLFDRRLHERGPIWMT